MFLSKLTIIISHSIILVAERYVTSAMQLQVKLTVLACFVLIRLALRSQFQRNQSNVVQS